MNSSRVSRPVPHTSSGLPGSRPGSSAAARRCRVAAPIAANSTPASAATSATCARSNPESCTVASPRPAPRCWPPGRRPAQNSSRVSASSARSPTRCTPYAAARACQAPSPAASAPECAATMVRPRSEAPAVSSTDGHVALGGGGKHAAQQRRVPDCLQDQREHLRLRQAQRVPGVRGGGGDELLPRRHRDREAERAPGAQQRGEHRPGVRDERDRPGRQRVPLHVADRAQPARHVHEPHAPRAAHGHPGVARGPRHACVA